MSSLTNNNKAFHPGELAIFALLGLMAIILLTTSGCGGSTPTTPEDGGAAYNDGGNTIDNDGGENWLTDGGLPANDDGGMPNDNDGGLARDGGQIDAGAPDAGHCPAQNCDDGIACTEDRLNDYNCQCEHIALHGRCGTGQICYPEQCHGCCGQPTCATASQCPDPHDPCIIITCEESTATCRYTPLDRDGDGHSPKACASVGGDDCNDTDRYIYLGAPKQCNGIDNDCDGQIDEGMTRSCTTACGTGTETCKAAGGAYIGWYDCTARTPTDETCNEIDDDCDNQTDENWSNKGQSCTVGVGACQRTGIYVCKADHTGTECSVQPGTPSQEICDGLDNNCDGRTDELWSNKGQPCAVGIGACQRTGIYVCKADHSGVECDTQPGQPTDPEICCNGLDDDCNGLKDQDDLMCSGMECDCCNGIDDNNNGFIDADDENCRQKEYWCSITNINAPSERYGHTAIWTGTEMIVWGGYKSTNNLLNDGKRYNPTTNQWTNISTTNAPSGRYGHTAIWTGTEMIVWGGCIESTSYGCSRLTNDGKRYNPTTNQWTNISTTNAPSERYGHTAIWTGTEMIVWGGYSDNVSGGYLKTGGRYNSTSNQWTSTTLDNAPEKRAYHTAIWTGTEMIVWGRAGSILDGGFWYTVYYNDGAKYNPTTNQWISTPTANAPLGRINHTAVWTGAEMIVWGGSSDNGRYLQMGGRYNPTTNQWTNISTTNAPREQDHHTVVTVWTGTEMIVWGWGYNDSARYNPTTNQWTSVSTTNAPHLSITYVAVWTGKEMIVWGRSGQDIDAGRYHP